MTILQTLQLIRLGIDYILSTKHFATVFPPNSLDSLTPSPEETSSPGPFRTSTSSPGPFSIAGEGGLLFWGEFSTDDTNEH